MPNRILKESICTSETIARLTWFQEVCFYRLLVTCDDFGRTDGRMKVLSGRLFPLAEVPLSDIQNAVNALSDVGLLRVYYAEDKPYIQITSWAKHQNIRAKKSKYPAPDTPEEEVVNVIQDSLQTSNLGQLVSRSLKAMSQRAWDELLDFMEDLPVPVIEWAINEAVEHGGNTWAYVRKVLANLADRGVKTVEEAQRKPQPQTQALDVGEIHACTPEEMNEISQNALAKLRRLG